MARNNPDPPAVTGNLIQLIIQLQQAGQTMEVVLLYMAPSFVVGSLTTLGAFITAWATANQGNLLSCLTADTTLSAIFAGDVNPGVTPTAETFPGAAGVVTGHSYPTTVAALITKLTGLKGQRGRGRSYMPGVPLSFVTPATSQDALNANPGILSYTAFFGAALRTVTTAAYGACVLVVGPAVEPPALIRTLAGQVTSFGYHTLLATQRRRREGRGQ